MANWWESEPEKTQEQKDYEAGQKEGSQCNSMGAAFRHDVLVGFHSEAFERGFDNGYANQPEPPREEPDVDEGSSSDDDDYGSYSYSSSSSSTNISSPPGDSPSNAIGRVILGSIIVVLVMFCTLIMGPNHQHVANDDTQPSYREAIINEPTHVSPSEDGPRKTIPKSVEDINRIDKSLGDNNEDKNLDAVFDTSIVHSIDVELERDYFASHWGTVDTRSAKKHFRISKSFSRKVLVSGHLASSEAFTAPEWKLDLEECNALNDPEGDREVEMIFFQINPDDILVGEEMNKAYDELGLRADPYALAAVNHKDKTFSRRYPNMTFWSIPQDSKDYQVLMFREIKSEDTLNIYCGHVPFSWHYMAFGVNWWYAGIRK
ncbi:MAG: hypothetical protein UW46_C0006G0016 [Candidatus Yanofskybacteria bacterium GW2011_GWF1_44_227]|uniref:Uncharacterized protein n=1 Tax=Candidatus Yanofskybacteria bacterium GW2011_GWE2_40_11 TaxID=1619033 RepID=A0A0G0T1P8_9BACT|nr:MAG: hypothetical protein UT69_C0002G0011 [Candidatus Yanofskybacteria bacterium GW2011_GWE1_40_10]KKR41030.1 MAG: hypothetical protein UT75_C0002G0067 [Candidatus Yanofskybacteria bacterium GW2011_GWE2_40_11]KKT15469.1 MAG: hypothetical protein UV97_C0006G0036 [Candidatus Yanofskybacteria bacterium GW2011_GWF2_43_596]KKT53115.1 MAG: hypothetical protein UW46_C0006G0016 [Candidatus Yanofskybacteria bacterium GW2011_GWF1_44_227]OGN35533.1 MAG: hypothetical protein A2207_02215 [Candidatus Yano